MTHSPTSPRRRRRARFARAWRCLSDDLPLLCSCADGAVCRGDCR